MNQIVETYIEGLGTVRQCIDCGCLVSGGPTRCAWCAELSAKSMWKKKIIKWLIGLKIREAQK